jgi:hypothetical protein
MKPAKILFFINGPSPAPEDLEQAATLDAQVMFRNARYVLPDSAVEECDGVAGLVPVIYAERPTAAEAIQTIVDKMAVLTNKAGDVPAPKAPAKPKTKK